MCTVSFERIRAEIEVLYAPPLRRKATRSKILQALAEFHAVGLRQSRDISPVLVGRWIQSHPGRNPQTTFSLLRSFRAICGYCKSQGYLRATPFEFRSPAQWVELDDPGQDDGAEPRDRHHSAEEIRGLLALLDREAGGGAWKPARLRALVYTYAYLGLRKMEALGLDLADLDLGRGTVRIRSHRRRRLKTRASAAVLYLPDPLAEVLAGWLPRTGSRWVFPTRDGRSPWTGGPPGYKPLDAVKAAGRRAGIGPITILDFRHTLGALAEGWGFSELELQRVLRHSRAATQQFYRKHPDDSVLRGAAAKISFRLVDATGT
jgi:integrase